MSDQATAPAAKAAEPNPLSDALDTLDEPSAIEPQRVLVLSVEQQEAILGLADGDHCLADLVAQGETYRNEADEIVRITLRKRRLEEEVRRINKRIADLEEPIVEQLTELGMKSMRHDDTGATIRRNDKVWIRYADEDLSSAEKAAVKAQAAEVMAAEGGDVAALVKPDYNSGTVSAYYRELYRNAVEEQQALPGHERRPVDPDSLLPEALRVYLRLDATPHIEVRAG